LQRQKLSEEFNSAEKVNVLNYTLGALKPVDSENF